MKKGGNYHRHLRLYTIHTDNHDLTLPVYLRITDH